MTRPIEDIAGEPLLPWQRLTQESGLLLHGAFDLDCDGEALEREFAALDADPTIARNAYGSRDGSWTSIPLVDRLDAGPGEPLGVLERLPTLRDLLDRLPAPVRGAAFTRQPPRGMLDWHFEPQAPILEETRLLIPVEVPPGARTLLGHLAVAYPRGRIWAGDFRFPHKVDNADDRQRVVVLVDLTSSDSLRARLPAALTAEPERRAALAGEGAALVNAWREGAAFDRAAGRG